MSNKADAGPGIPNAFALPAPQILVQNLSYILGSIPYKGGTTMKKKEFTPEQIITMLRMPHERQYASNEDQSLSSRKKLVYM
jgi:hypothetical protein